MNSLLQAEPFSTWTNSLGMEFVLIPAGEFLMGSPDSDPDARDDEKPQHRVVITQPFYISKRRVTWRQWESLMGPNEIVTMPNKDDLPMGVLYWNEVWEFLRRLRQKEGKEGYRLPTEAEWEYACRAGTTTRFFFGDDPEDLPDYAGISCDHPERKQSRPNPWGLYEMADNGFEFVQDGYNGKYYQRSPDKDPQGVPVIADMNHTMRGGDTDECDAASARCAARSFHRYPDHTGVGFRLVLAAAHSRFADDNAWEKAVRGKSFESICDYLTRFPQGLHAEEAEEAAWAATLKLNREECEFDHAKEYASESCNDRMHRHTYPFRDYLHDLPTGKYASQARTAIHRHEQEMAQALQEQEQALDLQWQAVLRENTLEAYCRYRKEHPKSRYARETDECAWKLVLTQGSDFASLLSYAYHFPAGCYTQQARKALTELAAKAPSPEAASYTNSIGMRLLRVEAGEFMMGSTTEETPFLDQEKPKHRVIISQPFYLGLYPVTQKEWQAVMGGTPCNPQEEKLPVSMTWEAAQAFIYRLNLQEGVYRYRLPTEAEWEYACRAGTSTAYFFGNDAALLTEYAWYKENSDGQLHPVGEKKPNPWGFYDLYGNDCEWVQDDWRYNISTSLEDPERKYYANGPITDPQGPSANPLEQNGYSQRLARGGHCDKRAEYTRSAWRGAPSDAGLRLVLFTALPDTAENESWREVCARDSLVACANHVRKFPGSIYRHAADERAWDIAQTLNTLEAFAAYRQRFPNGRYAERAEKEIERRRTWPTPKPLPQWTNSIGMEFLELPPGEFLMGAPENDAGAQNNEKPQHRVTLSRAFQLGKYPVTQAQWMRIMGDDPSSRGGWRRHCPVTNVNWYEIQFFIRRLNELEGTKQYRLPTEAEWEYACRAGSASRYAWGDDPAPLVARTWFQASYGPLEFSCPVGDNPPNPWGLYDLPGNVWQIVQDWYQADFYTADAIVDPQGPQTGTARVLRPGFSYGGENLFRSSARDWKGFAPGDKKFKVGFRLARSL